jgi:hypothetical protein
MTLITLPLSNSSNAASTTAPADDHKRAIGGSKRASSALFPCAKAPDGGGPEFELVIAINIRP